MKQYLDFSLAEEYFRKSMKYAYAEAFIGGTNFSNSMNLNGKYSKSNKNVYLLSYLESVLYCARACALQNKFSEAIQLTIDAYKLSPNYLSAGIDAVKYLCVINDTDKAIPLLDEIIEKNKFMTLRVIKDLDIICNDKISKYIDEISKESINKLDEKIKYYTRYNVNDYPFNSIINQAKTYLDKQSFLHAKLGLELLDENKDWLVNKLYV